MTRISHSAKTLATIAAMGTTDDPGLNELFEQGRKAMQVLGKRHGFSGRARTARRFFSGYGPRSAADLPSAERVAGMRGWRAQWILEDDGVHAIILITDRAGRVLFDGGSGDLIDAGLPRRTRWKEALTALLYAQAIGII